MSLALVDRLRVPTDAPVIDIGGGASLLVDRLLARGYMHLSVLDVSWAALEIARHRVGDAASVHWLRESSRPGSRTVNTRCGTTAPRSIFWPTPQSR
jgi:16S rRNA G1207 methylase RsmC